MSDRYDRWFQNPVKTVRVKEEPEYIISGSVATNQGLAKYDAGILQNGSGCDILYLKHNIHGKPTYKTRFPLNGPGVNKRNRKIARTLTAFYSYVENPIKGLDGNHEPHMSNKARKRSQASRKRAQSRGYSWGY